MNVAGTMFPARPMIGVGTFHILRGRSGTCPTQPNSELGLFCMWQRRYLKVRAKINTPNITTTIAVGIWLLAACTNVSMHENKRTRLICLFSHVITTSV